MGKIPQGILGGMSGTVGGIVGSSWKGINVIKTKPISVSNPKTAGQVAQRGKFGNAVNFQKQLLATIVKPLWDRFASQMSGYNASISENINYFEGVSPTAGSGYLMCKGKMAAPQITDITIADGGDEAEITWTDDSGIGFKLGTDVPYLIKFKPGNELAEGKSPAAMRSDGEVTVTFNEFFEAGETYVFQLAFKRADGTIVSMPDEMAVVCPV